MGWNPFKAVANVVSGVASAVASVAKSAVNLVVGAVNAVVGAVGAIVGGVLGMVSPNPDMPDAGQAITDTGVRVQLNPNTDNKIPVVYGTAFVKGIITDARISDNNKVMTYVLVLSEKTSGVSSILEAYWNDIRLNVGSYQEYSGGSQVFFINNAVTSAVNADGSSNSDFSINMATKQARIQIFYYTNGSNSPQITNGSQPFAYQVVPEWTPQHTMDGLVFAVVKIRYDSEKGITGLPTMTFKLQNTLKYPGDVWQDYLTNTRYGCGIPLSEVDTAATIALNNTGSQQISVISRIPTALSDVVSTVIKNI